MSELWTSKKVGARLARLGLMPLSWLYAGGWQVYLGVYRVGLKKAQSPHQPVVCIGNLQTGGSGKSPLVRHVAGVLRELGFEVVIGCSGYGSPRAEAATVAPSGELDPAVWGDEPAMFRWLEPEIPLVVGRRRVLAAELVHEAYPNAVLLMDDGFQHLPLKKQINILLDPVRPANSHCLPAGPYREPRFNRRRADLVIPGEFEVVAEPMRLVDGAGNEHRPGAYSVLCALGNPGLFLASLSEQFPNGASGEPCLFPDHDPLDGGTLLEGIPKELPIVVTAKDWVKLRKRADVGSRSFLVATHSVRIEPAAAFRDWLRKKLDE